MADAKPKPARASPAATAPLPPSMDKATAATSPSSLSWEDEEASVPDISAVLAKLSLEESKASKKKQEDDKDKRPGRRAPAPPLPPPPATTSKANTRQQPKPEPPVRAPVTPVQRRKPSSYQHQLATPSPTLSRYGADLGDIRGSFNWLGSFQRADIHLCLNSCVECVLSLVKELGGGLVFQTCLGACSLLPLRSPIPLQNVHKLPTNPSALSSKHTHTHSTTHTNTQT